MIKYTITQIFCVFITIVSIFVLIFGITLSNGKIECGENQTILIFEGEYHMDGWNSGYYNGKSVDYVCSDYNLNSIGKKPLILDDPYYKNSTNITRLEFKGLNTFLINNKTKFYYNSDVVIDVIPDNIQPRYYIESKVKTSCVGGVVIGIDETCKNITHHTTHLFITQDDKNELSMDGIFDWDIGYIEKR